MSSSRAVWLPLIAAAVAVPAALAGATLAWPGPQIGDQVGRAVAVALYDARVPHAGITVDGRAVTVDGVPAADRERAVDLLAGTGADPVTFTGDGAAPTAPGPASVTPSPAAPATPASATPAPADPAPAAPTDTAALQARLDALVATAPMLFEPDTPRLTPIGQATAERVRDLLVAAPGTRVRIDGFVAAGPGDGRLSAQELSRRRAETVRDILVAGGLPAADVAVRGLGEGPEPVADAAGRRVLVTVG